MMQIEWRMGLYAARDPELHTPDLMARGWRLNMLVRTYATSDITRVTPFAEYCVGEAKKRVDAFIEGRRKAIEASIAVASTITIPAPDGMEYRPYQKAGIAFSAARKDTLNADVPRLGKTIQAIGTANMLADPKRVLIICEANTKTQWKREWEKWAIHKNLSVGIINGFAVPSSYPDVVIINYAILVAHKDHLHGGEWDLMIVDEAHNLSGINSQRTGVVLGKYDKNGRGRSLETPPIRAKQRLFLTGTPIYTRPIGIWPVVRACDPESLGRNWYDFAQQYCGAEKANKWDATGHQNEEDLQFRLRKSFMIRREKSDVLAEIPPSRNTIVFPKDGMEKIVASEMSEFAQKLAQFEADALSERELFDLDPIDAVGIDAPITRQEVALAKLPMCIEWIKELLLTEKKVVIFAHHREVIKRLYEALTEYGVARVWGGMSPSDRDAERDAFQTDPDVRVFIGNIRAAGTGISLSAADVAVFVELSWSPAEVDQAEERIWLPEKTTPMTIYRLVVEDSVDMAVAHILDKRQESITRTMSKRFLASA